MVISPTVGCVVWFRGKAGPERDAIYEDQPEVAIITYVWSDYIVNLVIFDHEGNHRRLVSVALKQEDRPTPDLPYAEWISYDAAPAPRPERKDK